MKVTLLTTYAGPKGVGYPGTVLEINQAEAKELLEGNEAGGPYARKYNHDLDRKAKQGLQAYTGDKDE